MRIALQWLGGVGFKASTRQFKDIIIDEPPDFHGNDRGPSSVEYIGVAIGGCLGTSFAYCLQKMEVVARRIDLSLDVEMHYAGDEEKNPLRITNIDATITVELENPDDTEILDLCIESFKRYCVVTQSVMGGIPVNVHVSKS
nr:OsmC family protein [Candidatus Sigynarchaeota archaeon]